MTNLLALVLVLLFMNVLFSISLVVRLAKQTQNLRKVADLLGKMSKLI